MESLAGRGSKATPIAGKEISAVVSDDREVVHIVFSV